MNMEFTSYHAKVLELEMSVEIGFIFYSKGFRSFFEISIVPCKSFRSFFEISIVPCESLKVSELVQEDR
jgi:hypothetical protein